MRFTFRTDKSTEERNATAYIRYLEANRVPRMLVKLEAGSNVRNLTISAEVSIDAILQEESAGPSREARKIERQKETWFVDEIHALENKDVLIVLGGLPLARQPLAPFAANDLGLQALVDSLATTNRHSYTLDHASEENNTVKWFVSLTDTPEERIMRAAKEFDETWFLNPSNPFNDDQDHQNQSNRSAGKVGLQLQRVKSKHVPRKHDELEWSSARSFMISVPAPADVSSEGTSTVGDSRTIETLKGFHQQSDVPVGTLSLLAQSKQEAAETWLFSVLEIFEEGENNWVASARSAGGLSASARPARYLRFGLSLPISIDHTAQLLRETLVHAAPSKTWRAYCQGFIRPELLDALFRRPVLPKAEGVLPAKVNSGIVSTDSGYDYTIAVELAGSPVVRVPFAVFPAAPENGALAFPPGPGDFVQVAFINGDYCRPLATPLGSRTSSYQPDHSSYLGRTAGISNNDWNKIGKKIEPKGVTRGIATKEDTINFSSKEGVIHIEAKGLILSGREFLCISAPSIIELEGANHLEGSASKTKSDPYKDALDKYFDIRDHKLGIAFWKTDLWCDLEIGKFLRKLYFAHTTRIVQATSEVSAFKFSFGGDYFKSWVGFHSAMDFSLGLNVGPESGAPGFVRGFVSAHVLAFNYGYRVNVNMVPRGGPAFVIGPSSSWKVGNWTSATYGTSFGFSVGDTTNISLGTQNSIVTCQAINEFTKTDLKTSFLQCNSTVEIGYGGKTSTWFGHVTELRDMHNVLTSQKMTKIKTLAEKTVTRLKEAKINVDIAGDSYIKHDCRLQDNGSAIKNYKSSITALKRGIFLGTT